VLWSWYGAGKTHSLYYLRNEALAYKNQPIRLIPIYTEFPKGARGFIDLYRSFMAAFEYGLLLDAFLEFQTTARGDQFYQKLLLQEPDFATALRLLAMGDAPRQQVAQRWLRGDVLAVSDLRAVGISQRISNAQQATRVLCLTMRLLPALQDPDVDHFVRGVIQYVRQANFDVEAAMKKHAAATKETFEEGFFPFTVNAVEAIKSHTDSLTPRAINMQMTRALGRAHRKNLDFISTQCVG
jgi:hypothetical protein